MIIKWNKTAVKQLIEAIEFIEEHEFYSYAIELERRILSRVHSLPNNYKIYPLDKYKKKNDGSYRAFETDSYRVSYRVHNNEIKILRVRHTSRRPRKY